MEFSFVKKKYAAEVLNRFGMSECNAVENPIVLGHKFLKDERGTKVNETHFKQIIGSLMYLTVTRPDLTFIVSLISRFMANPTEMHLQAAKRALRYVKGTIDYGIFYRRNENERLMPFTDSDYAGDPEDRKSTSCYVFMMSNGVVTWSSKK